MSENKFPLGALAGCILTLLAVVGLYEADVDTPVSQQPHAETPAVEAPCPDGWDDTSSLDEHTAILSCQRNGWVVILKESGEFDYGFQLDTPGAEFVRDPRRIPGWP